MKPRVRNTLVLVVVAAGLAGGAWYLRQSSSDGQPGAGGPGGSGGPGGPPATGRRGPMGSRGGGSGPRTISVNVATAEIGTISERLLLTGSLKPKEQVDVTPKSTGRVKKVVVHVGDRVRVGDVIAELERDELNQQLRRAEAAINVSRASMAQRQAELANAEARLDRSNQLNKEGLISSQDYDAQVTSTEVVRTQVQLAEAQLQQVEAELRELKIRVEQASIYAPIDGYVAARNADVGALLGPNSPIVRLVNLDTMITAANVPERDLGKLRVGNTAVVRVDALGERAFTGRVARIGPVLDAATRSAIIEIEISNPGALLKAEMFARVELNLASTRKTVVIPRDGLVYRGRQAGVYLVKGDEPEFHAIELGLTQGDQVEVLANLEPGTTIVAKGSSMISEGDTIVIVGEDGAAGRPGAANPLARQGLPTGADPGAEAQE